MEGQPEHQDRPEVLVQHVSEDEAVVFAPEGSAFNQLGETVADAPPPFLAAARRALVAAPLFADATSRVSGRVVRLTTESARLLREGEAVERGGEMIGLVRDSNSGRFVGHLAFESTAAGAAMSALPALAAGIALQRQLAILEEKLDAIQRDVDYLIEAKHHEIDAEAQSALEVHAEVSERVRRRGEVHDDEWARVVTWEPSVRRLHAETRAHLRSLHQLFDTEGIGLSVRVKRLDYALRQHHAGFWLHNHVLAELALCRWQWLQLLRQAAHHPDELSHSIESTRDDLQDRHRELNGLARQLAAHVGADDHVTGFFDRVRLGSRRQLQELLLELNDVLGSFGDSLAWLPSQHEQPELKSAGPVDDPRWRDLIDAVAEAADSPLRRIQDVGSVAESRARQLTARAGHELRRVRRSPHQSDES